MEMLAGGFNGWSLIAFAAGWLLWRYLTGGWLWIRSDSERGRVQKCAAGKQQGPESREQIGLDVNVQTLIEAQASPAIVAVAENGKRRRGLMPRFDEVETEDLRPFSCPLCGRPFTREQLGENKFRFWCEDCRLTEHEAFREAIFDAIDTGMKRAELCKIEPEDLRRIVYLLDASGGDWTGVLGKWAKHNSNTGRLLMLLVNTAYKAQFGGGL